MIEVLTPRRDYFDCRIIDNWRRMLAAGPFPNGQAAVT
jgi:hypothetical protein